MSTYLPGRIIITEEAFTAGDLEEEFGGNVLFTIYASRGKDISDKFLHATRKILFIPGTRFLIVSVEQIADNVYVLMKEMVV